MRKGRWERGDSSLSCVSKNAEKDDFDQRLECAAPKRWSKYTTATTAGLFGSFIIQWFTNDVTTRSIILKIKSCLQWVYGKFLLFNEFLLKIDLKNIQKMHTKGDGLHQTCAWFGNNPKKQSKSVKHYINCI